MSIKRPHARGPLGQPRHPLRAPSPASRSRQLGQVLPLFALMSVVLLGGAALLTDVAWWWTVEQRMQRAADAAALAGAIALPDDPDEAKRLAIAEAAKNGFVNGEGVGISALPHPQNKRRLIVDIDGAADTHFARVFGLQRVAISVTGVGEFVLPVPMGSPENYYGVFGRLRRATFTRMVPNPPSYNEGRTDWEVATAAQPGGQWASTSGNIVSVVSGEGSQYAYETTSGESQEWRNFGLSFPSLSANQTLEILGIEVRLTDAFVSATCTNSRIRADLWRASGPPSGGGFTASLVETPNLRTNSSDGDYALGSASDLSVWDTGTWSSADFSDASFRVRLTAVKGCLETGTRVNLDQLQVRVSYQVVTRTSSPQVFETNDPLEGPGTRCANGLVDCFNPDGADLNARGFWATMNTRGASNVNGDAHQPYYDTASGTVAPKCDDPAIDDSRACHDPELYYNYAVEMPPNSKDGYVYVFDPGFCATDKDRGTGDRWFSNATPAVSSWYELKGPINDTPYDLTDDPLIASTGDLFENMDAADSTMGASGGAECFRRETAYGDGRDYHLSWYLLNPDNPLTGGPKGTTYRIHTTGTDPAGVVMSNTNGEQSFALFVSATTAVGTRTPRIYGLGAMQAFTPLSSAGGSTFAEFYLAQIDAVHAGKTVRIKLWDPGDTAPLTANLEVRIPNNLGGWSPARLDYSAKTGTSDSSINTTCNSDTGDNVLAIWTETSTSTWNNKGEFNGCWLTIDVQVPKGYTGAEDGWWKIRYNMTGSGTSNDVTTWKVNIIGNPVHLVPK